MAISSLYVDDLLRVGTDVFRYNWHFTTSKFESNDSDSVEFVFTAFNNERLKNGELTVNVNGYLQTKMVSPTKQRFYHKCNSRERSSSGWVLAVRNFL